jgi:outer membrane protein TolC
MKQLSKMRGNLSAQYHDGVNPLILPYPGLKGEAWERVKFSSIIKRLAANAIKHGRFITIICLLILSIIFLTGCKTPSGYRIEADKAAVDIIREKQTQALGNSEPFSIERPSDILRRRLLIEQHLPYAGEASLGSDRLKQIAHWPEKDYPRWEVSPEPSLPIEKNKSLRLSLLKALQIGARNSFEYQTKKEDIFRATLDLDIERNEFRNTFRGHLEGLIRTDVSPNDAVTGTETSGSIGWSRTLKSGVQFSAALALDLVKLLTQEKLSSLGIVGDATITIPLLRGAGKHIVTEPLTQAERNVLYGIYEFERFKKTFSVSIASNYLEVLRQYNVAENAEENYRSLIKSTHRTRRMADAGRTSEVAVGQALQNELRSRNRWILAQELYKSRLDSFKRLVGLPPDAHILLEKIELERLLIAPTRLKEEISRDIKLKERKKESSKEESVQMVKPDRKNAGPLEMDPSLAVKLGLERRLDLRVAHEKVFDAQRKLVVLADSLRAELTLFGSAKLGEARSIETAGLDTEKLRTDKGIYTALLTIDLPFERTAERNAYRMGFIALERAIRDAQDQEDEIKLSIRDRLRSMYESGESLLIQTRALVVAEERVKSTSLYFEAGRAQIRDLLEAEEALINAKNALTSAAVAYRVAELEFQSDTGLLQVDGKGLWLEYTPEGLENVKKN